MNSKQKQRGAALVFALLGITILSLLAAALLFVSNQETFAALNYKRQVQAVYGSTAGVQSGLNWFRTTYNAYIDNQATGVVDTAAYDLSGLQPTYGGNPVTLGGASANFPSSTIKTNFNTMRDNSASPLAIGTATVSYSMIARLLSHERHKNVAGDQTVIAERWQLGITGTIPNPGSPTASYVVQENAIIERFFVPTYKDAIRGQCNVNINGNLTTDSYYSTAGAYNVGGNIYTGADAGAGVGSNATLDLKGSSILVNGNASYGQDTATCPSTSKVPSGDIAGTVTEAPPVPFPPITPTFTTTIGGAAVCAPAALTVTSTSLPSGTVGFSYTSYLTATGGTLPYTWTVPSGTLPAGITVSSDGTISGTPITANTYTFTVRVTDGAGLTADQPLTLRIATSLIITGYSSSGTPHASGGLPDAKKNTAYPLAGDSPLGLTATGGNTPYTWSVASGSLPPGVTLNTNGTFSGSVGTTLATYQFTLRVTDANTWVATKDFCLQVNNSGNGKNCTAGSSTTTGGGSVSGGPSATFYFSKPNAVATYYGQCKLSGSDHEVLCVPSGTSAPQPFFFTDIQMTGSASLDIRLGDPLGNCTYQSPLCSTVSCAPVKLYISNVMSLGGNGTVGAGSPLGLSVLYTGTNSSTGGCGTDLCEYNGSSAFYGTIYAPNANCCIRGNTDFYGAVSANNVSTGSAVNVHYDLALGGQSGYATTFRIVNQTRAVF